MSRNVALQLSGENNIIQRRSVTHVRHNSNLFANTKNLTNIKRLNAAVWHRSSKLEEINDEPSIIIEDWGKSFKEQTNESSNTIQGFTISEIIDQSYHQFIDLLKIDVGGAERFIFNKEISDLNFLKITRCIAIAIHDEFDIREEINQILNDYNFALFKVGELTIGIKNGYGN